MQLKNWARPMQKVLNFAQNASKISRKQEPIQLILDQFAGQQHLVGIGCSSVFQVLVVCLVLVSIDSLALYPYPCIIIDSTIDQ